MNAAVGGHHARQLRPFRVKRDCHKQIRQMKLCRQRQSVVKQALVPPGTARKTRRQVNGSAHLLQRSGSVCMHLICEGTIATHPHLTLNAGPRNVIQSAAFNAAPNVTEEFKRQFATGMNEGRSAVTPHQKKPGPFNHGHFAQKFAIRRVHARQTVTITRASSGKQQDISQRKIQRMLIRDAN